MTRSYKKRPDNPTEIRVFNGVRSAIEILASWQFPAGTASFFIVGLFVKTPPQDYNLELCVYSLLAGAAARLGYVDYKESHLSSCHLAFKDTLDTPAKRQGIIWGGLLLASAYATLAMDNHANQEQQAREKVEQVLDAVESTTGAFTPRPRP